MRFPSKKHIMSASLALSTLLAEGGEIPNDLDLDMEGDRVARTRQVFQKDESTAQLRRQVLRLNHITRTHAPQVREGLARWKPGHVQEPLGRTRNFMNLSALMDLAYRPQRSVVSYLINEKLLKEERWADLRTHLTAVILQAADAPVMTDEPHLGLVFPMPDHEVRTAMIRSAQQLLHALLIFRQDAPVEA